MKTCISLLLIAFFPAMMVAGQQPFPADAEAFYQKAMSQINAKHVTWIKRTATDVNNKNLDERAVNDLAKKYGNLSGLNGQDIEAIAFLVLMQAAKSAQEDLKAIMDQVKSINEQKKKLRDAQQYLEKIKDPSRAKLDSFRLIAKNIKTTNSAQPARVQTTSQTTRVQTTKIATPVSTTEISNVKTELKNKLDSMSEMGETTSLRLQMMMDRRSKFISTLSNIMKKFSDTQDSIIQNMK